VPAETATIPPREESATVPAEAEVSVPKLTKKTVEGPIALECGIFKWKIAWELDKATTKGGLIVQKVAFKYHDTKDCKGNEFSVTSMLSKEKFDPSLSPFWEAWEIGKNSKVTKYAGSYDDRYEAPAGFPRSKGVYTITGAAEFYEGARLADTNLAVTHTPPAGELPMTSTDPKLKGGTGSIPHNLEATWDCCSVVATKDTKIKKE
jgi:hypothetical protein